MAYPVMPPVTLAKSLKPLRSSMLAPMLALMPVLHTRTVGTPGSSSLERSRRLGASMCTAPSMW